MSMKRSFQKHALIASQFVWLLCGVASAQVVNQTIPGANNDRFGEALACQGPRLLIGLPGASAGSGGAELRLPGSATAPRSFPNVTGSTSGELGYAVAIIEQKNAAGVFGYAIAAPFQSPGGAVYIYPDPGSGTLSNPTSSFGGSTSDGYGRALADIGDQSGDGISELAIGAPNGVVNYVQVVNPATGQVRIASITGNTTERFGSALTSLPDLNADGRTELVIGGPRYLGSGQFGRVMIYDAFVGTPIANIFGDVVNLDFGAALANAGDINGDLIDDLIVGMPVNPNVVGVFGRARVYDGSTLGSTPTILCELIGDDIRFGSAVSGAGDLNGDGRNDFAVGNPGFSTQLSSTIGKVSVFSFNSVGNCGEIVTFTGGTSGDQYGVSVSGNTLPISAFGCELTADGIHDLPFGIVAGDNVPGGVVIVAGAPAPTPTPPPTPTPTATPQPTPVQLDRVNLRIRLNSAGAFSAEMRFDPPEILTAPCELRLLARTEVEDTLGPIVELLRTSTVGPNFTVSAVDLPRAEVQNCVRPAIHMVARLDCGTRGIAQSPVEARYLNCGPGSGISVEQWIQNLTQGLQATAAARAQGRKVRAVRYRYRAPARARARNCATSRVKR